MIQMFRKLKRENSVLVTLLIVGSVIVYWNFSSVPSPAVLSNFDERVTVHSIESEVSRVSLASASSAPAPSVSTEPLAPENFHQVINQESSSKTEKKNDEQPAIGQENGKEKDWKVPTAKAEAPTTIVIHEYPHLKCPVQIDCPAKQFGYYIQSGIGHKHIHRQAPIICFNNRQYLGDDVEPANFGRGANVVVIHPQLHTVMDIKLFDLYGSFEQCLEMAIYLSKTLPWKAIVMIASYDDMSAAMCAPLQKLLNQYGAHMSRDIKFREGYVLLGEKGLPGSLGKEEKIAVPPHGDFAVESVNVSGCSDFPISLKYVDVGDNVAYTLDNCGIATCGYDEIEMHIATGYDDIRKPRLCIGNEYIYYPGLYGGRGFNLVELDPISKTVIRTAIYDTYETESSRMELFLEGVKDTNYLIAIVSDDGSVSLKSSSRKMLKDFGYDGDVIRMRTALYFIGQRGLKESPFQQTGQTADPKAWPAPISERFCLPTELVDRTASQAASKERQNFCSKHDSFADFCFVHHKTEPLVTAPAPPQASEIQDVYDVPILVLAGLNNIALSHTLQSIVRQPGIKRSSVYVAYSTMFGEDYGPFIDVFEFNKIEVQPIAQYASFLSEALGSFIEKNPEMRHMIVVDDEVIGRDGFIWYMGHALKIMKADSAFGAASAWNPQGFEGVASNHSKIRVTDQFSGMAFLMSKQFYLDEIKGKESLCCRQRSIQTWFPHGLSQRYKFLIPEVSRCSLFSSTAYSAQVFPMSQLLISQPRVKPLVNASIHPLDISSASDYDGALAADMSSAYYSTQHDLTVCTKNGDAGRARAITSFLPEDKKSLVVVYKQAMEGDNSALSILYPCFGLVLPSNQTPLASYKEVTSFTMNDINVYLVGTSSVFFKDYIQHSNQSPYIAAF